MNVDDRGRDITPTGRRWTDPMAARRVAEARRDAAMDLFYKAIHEGDDGWARQLLAEWPEFAQDHVH
jgi:hypothetical protein